MGARGIVIGATAAALGLAGACGSGTTGSGDRGPSRTATGAFPDAETAARCPRAPQGDAAAHLALVDQARRDPTPENIRRLEGEQWTQLWAVTARMGAVPADDRWPAACRRGGNPGDVAGSPWLECSQVRWGDAAALLALPDARSVACNVCRVGDLAPLSRHPRLDDLFLSDTFLEAPGSLAALTSLEALTLQNTNATTVRLLAALTGLRKLNLSGPLVHDLEGIDTLANLAELEVGGDCLRSIDPLRHLTRIQHLSLWGWQVSDVSPVETMTGLHDLVLIAPRAARPPSFAKLTALRSLVWQGRALTHLDDLAALPDIAKVAILFHCVPDDAIARLRAARPGLKLDVGERSPHCPSP